MLLEVTERVRPHTPRRRPGEDDVDALVPFAGASSQVPGVSVAAARYGEILKSAGYGVVSLELGTPAGPDIVYEIGSITKQSTASLVMVLVEEGKVELDSFVTDRWTGCRRSGSRSRCGIS
jgi:CubicO group peptidase (beta-lactamase class C family)